MKIARLFTKNLKSPYEGIEFVERLSRCFSENENLTFVAPKDWSQVAVDILAQKYRCRTSHAGIGETDARQIFDRLSETWAYFAQRSGLLNNSEAAIFSDECKYMLAHQVAAPNSPQWFNTGLFHAYQLQSTAKGHYYVDDKSREIIELENALERPQAHACFIQGVKDELVGPGSIMDLWEREARLFKFGSGSGSNFSALRGAGEPLSSGGVSSGLMSWLKIGDAGAGAVKSGGTTRRAAKMVCLDADHPDIEEFINWKYKEEQKVAFLVTGQRAIRRLYFLMLEDEAPSVIDQYKEEHSIDEVVAKRLEQMKQQGIGLSDFDGGQLLGFDWQGEAYQTIAGQNANNSIRLSHAFLEAVERKTQWSLINRTDNKKAKSIEAHELFEKMATAAWGCADPGLQFSDTINEWHTCPQGGSIVASNPCSEYMFLDDTACNLASLNLVKFLKNGKFDHELFSGAVQLWSLVLEISVSMASYPSKEIALRSFEYRTLGLGYANMGGLFMRLGLAYDSDEARNLAGAISALMSGEGYRASAWMAERLGPFTHFEANKDDFMRVMKNHASACDKEPSLVGVSHKPCGLSSDFPSSQEVVKAARASWKNGLEALAINGARNAQMSAIAPTGTISLLMDCDTTGIEPDYSLIKYKSLAGGGSARIVNQSTQHALTLLGYSKEQQEEMIAFILKENGVDGAPFLDPLHYSIFDCATSIQKQGRALSVECHLSMMASVQPFVSGAISKTINIPAESQVLEVKEAFLRAYNLGLKAVAIYRDRSKLSQPLSQIKEDSLRLSAFSHLACLNCGKKMLVPTGTCMRCENCGESTSCS